MIRERQEIQQEIINEVNNKLPELNSQSSTAIWRLWTFIVSMSIWTFEKILDVAKTDIDNIILSKRIGALYWYNKMSKDFQYNYDLKVNEYGEYYYETVDEQAKIIAVASCTYNESDEGLRIKVARKSSRDNSLEPLSLDQLEKFETYINKVKILGTKINVVNVNADQLILNIDIYTSRLIDNSIIIKKTTNRINEFLSNIPFDGVFNKNDFIDHLRDDNVIQDILINEMYIMEGTKRVDFNRNYTSKAGYIIFDRDSSNLQNR